MASAEPTYPTFHPPGSFSASYLAEQAFSRAAGAPLIPGNQARILRNAEENYPAWLAAIREAKQRVHFESYIIKDDRAGPGAAREASPASGSRQTPLPNPKESQLQSRQ